MTLETIISNVIHPVMALLPAAMDSPQARVYLLASGLQESRFKDRYQIVQGRPGAKGPARGFWQFEQGTQSSRGGVWGVYLHEASRYWLSIVCAARGVAFKPRAIWERMETDDVLAAALARLLMFTDAQRLPEVRDEEGDGSCTCAPGGQGPGRAAASSSGQIYGLSGLETMRKPVKLCRT